uniref:Uncharacterized protein n=1 Tax=Anguilla anguilla TaxID=7936 RepID=A0A0E9W6I5_ANGAN
MTTGSVSPGSYSKDQGSTPRLRGSVYVSAFINYASWQHFTYNTLLYILSFHKGHGVLMV